MFAAAFSASRLGFPARRLRTARRARCRRASIVEPFLINTSPAGEQIVDLRTQPEQIRQGFAVGRVVRQQPRQIGVCFAFDTSSARRGRWRIGPALIGRHGSRFLWHGDQTVEGLITAVILAPPTWHWSPDWSPSRPQQLPLLRMRHPQAMRRKPDPFPVGVVSPAPVTLRTVPTARLPINARPPLRQFVFPVVAA